MVINIRPMPFARVFIIIYVLIYWYLRINLQKQQCIKKDTFFGGK